MPDPTQSTPAPKATAAPKKAVRVDPQQILDVVQDAERLIGWKHLSNKARSALVGGLATGIVGIILGIVQP